MTQFSWKPGIGDPSIGGWITVILYFLAAVSCWATACKLDHRQQERRIWRTLSISFFALGINKQLDLQSALTVVGRMFAESQGWYDQRQLVQFAFVILVAIVCVVALITLLVWALNAPLPTWVALSGATLVIGFVIIRAASFHHIDRFIGSTIFGFHWNWIMEMGGIGIVLLASRRRHEQL